MTSPPRFTASPNQFAPTRGHAANDEARFPGATVKLFGVFGGGAISVQVSDVAATILARSPSRIDVQLPALAAGNYRFTVASTGGSVVSDDAFQVAEFPELQGLDPLGFSHDPSEEGIVITVFGQHLRMSDCETSPHVSCVLTPRVNPDVQTTSVSIDMEVARFEDVVIRLPVPPIPEFDRFVGGRGFILVEFADGVTLQTEGWEIEGL